jgi:hypothetical protein
LEVALVESQAFLVEQAVQVEVVGWLAQVALQRNQEVLQVAMEMLAVMLQHKLHIQVLVAAVLATQVILMPQMLQETVV